MNISIDSKLAGCVCVWMSQVSYPYFLEVTPSTWKSILRKSIKRVMVTSYEPIFMRKPWHGFIWMKELTPPLPVIMKHTVFMSQLEKFLVLFFQLERLYFFHISIFRQVFLSFLQTIIFSPFSLCVLSSKKERKTIDCETSHPPKLLYFNEFHPPPPPSKPK